MMLMKMHHVQSKMEFLSIILKTGVVITRSISRLASAVHAQKQSTTAMIARQGRETKPGSRCDTSHKEHATRSIDFPNI